MKILGLPIRIIAITIFLMSCSVLPKQQMTPSSKIATEIPTLVPFRSATPDNTASRPISSPAVSNTPLAIQCLNIFQNLQAGSTIKGTVVYREINDPRLIYLWDMNTGDKKLIPIREKEILGDFIVSPNGHWLAYTRSTIDGIRTISKILEIISADGQLREQITIDVNSANLSRWLDDEQLIIREDPEPASNQIVINPFTKQQQELIADLPDIYNNNPNLTWRQQGIVIFDPTLTLIAYAGMPADIVLLERKNTQVITRVSPVPIADSIPLWSPNGAQFVITSADISNPDNLHYELFSVSRLGKVTQLTNLAAYYRKTFILSYTWSPDGRYIAFWFENNLIPTGTVNLAILDVSTLEVKNYCIDSIYEEYSTPPPLFWSPDSRQMVVEVKNRNDPTSTQLVLIDILGAWAARIAENVIPMGWMSTE